MQPPNAKKQSKSKPEAPIPRSNPSLARARILINWFHRQARDLPWRHTTDPYAIWVSEIMLQQTQVKTVLPYWHRWMKAFPTIESLAAAAPETIHKMWEGLGYYTRVRNLQRGATNVLNLHGGVFPRSFDAVLELPGVGRYTAGAICSIAFNQPTPILDGNVIRVLCRYFAIDEPVSAPATREKLWYEAHQLVLAAASLPAKPHPSLSLTGNCSALNQSLMELGATVCKPRQPECIRCPLEKTCASLHSGTVDSLPNLDKRPAATAKEVTAFVIHFDDNFLVRRRPSGGINAHLWEFPSLESSSTAKSAPLEFKKAYGLQLKNIKRIQDIRHSITRFRITLTVYQAKLASQAKDRLDPEWLWASWTALHSLPFTAAHRKIIKHLASPSAGR